MQQNRRKLSPSFKIWLRTRNKDIIGKGGATLLKAIQKHGSITKAAKELGFSYKFAWDQLADMDRKLRGPVITTKRGGATGGGARLTKLAKTLLEEYKTAEELVEKTIQKEKEPKEMRVGSTAENRLRGVVKLVYWKGAIPVVRIEISVPATIEAVISKEAAEDSRIKLGDTVDAVFRSKEILIVKKQIS